MARSSHQAKDIILQRRCRYRDSLLKYVERERKRILRIFHRRFRPHFFLKNMVVKILRRVCFEEGYAG